MLPEKLLDETAYHLVNFMFELSHRLESLYFDQLRRYDRDLEDKRNQEGWR
jgi:hypothetical protein